MKTRSGYRLVTALAGLVVVLWTSSISAQGSIEEHGPGEGATASPGASAKGEIVIRATALDPHVLRVVSGQRVEFVKDVDGPVHVELGEDARSHRVFQIPSSGRIWAIFHRPGTHTYVVHVYDGKTTVLHGLVEVEETPEHPWGLGECRAIVMENCIEP